MEDLSFLGVFDKDILKVLGDTRRFWRIFIFKNIRILSHVVQHHINDHPKLEELVVAYESRTAGGLLRRDVWTHLIFRENVGIQFLGSNIHVHKSMLFQKVLLILRVA